MGQLRPKPSHYLNRDAYATRAETLERLFAAWPAAAGEERVPLEEADGRTASRDAVSINTLPVHQVAAADGVAVKYAAFENGFPDYSNWQENVDYAAADMGDDVADDFDTVMWVESFTFSDDGRIKEIEPDDELTKGMLIRRRGATVEAGERVLKKGQVISPFQLGLLRAAGLQDVYVVRRPRVAFIPSGSELIPAGQTPGRGENVESNSLMVRSLLARWQADVTCFPIVLDEREALELALRQALADFDIVLLNGGTSMGTDDISSSLIRSQASFHQHGVRCIPGIPIAVSVVAGTPVINLPGPPFAAFCALDWCVKALIGRWYGRGVWPRKTVGPRRPDRDDRKAGAPRDDRPPGAVS